MLKISTFIKAIVVLASLFLFIGCGNDSKTTTKTVNAEVPANIETNTSQVTETTPKATVTPKSLTLTVAKTTLNKGDITTVEVVATYDDNSTKVLTNVEWIVTPKESVKVNGTTLTALKDNNVTLQAKVGLTLSNTIKLNITWIVNGYTLPPEPDKALNDSTLLGIDLNNNDVRDDVERYILQTYGNEKITIEIGFQVSRAYDVVIEHPENALETDKVLSKAQDCASYFSTFATFLNDPILLDDNIVVSKRFQSIQLNTRERIKNFLLYNQKLSGGIFTSTPIDERKEKCNFDVDTLLKARK